MTKNEFATLRPGDLVRHKIDDHASIVTDNFGDYVLAVRTVHMTNPDEWDLVARSPSIVQITSTRAAVDHIIQETGLEPDTAGELLQTVLSMVQLKVS